MKKGTIMTIDQKYAYVFTTDCQMEKILWKPGMAIGREIKLGAESISRTAAFLGSRTFQKAFVAACLAVVLVVGMLAAQGMIFNPVYARLSIDVNPSIELLLNRHMAVYSVRILNEEARQVLGDEDLRGLPWRDAVERWTLLLRERFQENIQNMLISAVVPDQASQFIEQLMNMEETANQGVFKNVAVRVIYTKDVAVTALAKKNGLSVGRQMLLNQSVQQQKQWTAGNIGDAPLGEMIQQLLRKGEPDQTGMTRRTTQSATYNGGESSGTGETSRETSGGTNRETNQETSGNTQGSGTQGTGTQGSGTRETSREINRETSCETSCESQNCTCSSGEGTPSTNQETSRETGGEPSGSTMGATQTSRDAGN